MSLGIKNLLSAEENLKLSSFSFGVSEEKIQSSLDRVGIENHSALAMTLSLLVSTEENYFPHYLDKLISGSLVTNQTIIENNSENDFNLLSSLNIARIEVETLSEDESRALRVIFRDQNLNIVFWVGRIADIILSLIHI